MACVQYLPLCSPPKIALREGQAGAYAYLNVIGIGPWYASGQTVTAPSASKSQDLSRTYTGTVKPNTFSKGFAGYGSASCPA